MPEKRANIICIKKKEFFLYQKTSFICYTEKNPLSLLRITHVRFRMYE
jgi:hypothetical protein